MANRHYTECAPAKINLCLHLTGLRDDGYHLLESLVVFTEFGDVLRVINEVDVTDADTADALLETARRRLELEVQRGAQRLLERPMGLLPGADDHGIGGHDAAGDGHHGQSRNGRRRVVHKRWRWHLSCCGRRTTQRDHFDDWLAVD